MKCKPFDLKRRSHAQWYTSAILVPDKLRQKDHKFKASLGYRVRPLVGDLVPRSSGGAG